MELKEYQQKALEIIKNYLEAVDDEKNHGNSKHAALDAWEVVGPKDNYIERKNGLEQDLPNFCIKIPTGGGKTLLAVKAIDLVNTMYRKKRTGLILWIVPTHQIYEQTIKGLKDREHPYRQHLDIASGGKTTILEKTDQFTPLDIEENLVVLMLMLPSASRQSKETLRIFRDNGGFQEFFPPEDRLQEHEKMLEQLPNLDTFSEADGFWGRQIKTSLGNVLKTLSPLIILDEGHKAYSATAQETLREFNPCMLIELSATPPEQSNILVDIRGIELNREEMIKLDLHVINKANPDWKNTLLASVEHRNKLEEKAKSYEANTSNYIRPICLIQVERTGKDQRDGNHIHAEDAREYLIKEAGILPEQVAVTSSELKELAGLDLLSRDCPVRYIITKQALQEGWDCAFAYILTVLTNPGSKNALTQLVGRILRQPRARKTGITELDESYVFAFHQGTNKLLSSIQDGFKQEGLGDLAGRIITETSEDSTEKAERVYEIRDRFKQAAKEVVLPLFAINDHGSWRAVNYATDIASKIDWTEADLEPLKNLLLSEKDKSSIEVTVGISDNESNLLESHGTTRIKEGGLTLDPVFLTRHLLEVIPNPWQAHQMGQYILEQLQSKYNSTLVVRNFVYIIEELKKHLANEKNRLAQEIFKQMIASEELRFIVIGKDFGFHLPQTQKVKGIVKPLYREHGEQQQLNLFDFIAADEFNEDETRVAWYLEEHEKLFFWYRNVPRQDYYVQGWRKEKIYPDFIFTTDNNNDLEKIFVVETKGIHLKYNADTAYKEEMLNLCNQLAEERSLNELNLGTHKPIGYKVVYSDEWQQKLNELLA